TDLHASPAVGDGMVFVATNKQNYYGVNVTTGDIEWKYVTTEGTEGIGGYLVASMGYHDGELYIIDMFFITALDANTGEVVWKSWIGTELYTSPTYADDKVYVTTDRRFVYVLNATNGARLAFFETGSNSWSAPSVYEGRLYFGSNDNNVYCLDDYPVMNGKIFTKLDKDQVAKGEVVTGHGHLTPGIAQVPITVSFLKPDGTVDSMQVAAQKDGAFSFNYTPDVVGEWTVSIRCSGATYIMESVELSLNVVIPQQQTAEPEQTSPEHEQSTRSQDSITSIGYAALATVLGTVAVIVIIAYLFIRKRNKSSPILISD
ncbi:MAG: PQQ-binding-like beta-propeller repeat protein, partial [Candidatus Bathyarchaeota archaeon]